MTCDTQCVSNKNNTHLTKYLPNALPAPVGLVSYWRYVGSGPKPVAIIFYRFCRAANLLVLISFNIILIDQLIVRYGIHAIALWQMYLATGRENFGFLLLRTSQ